MLMYLSEILLHGSFTHICVKDHDPFFFSQKSTVTQNAGSIEFFTALVQSVETSQSELLELTEEKQKLVERQAEGLIKDLEQEITVLKRSDTQLEQLLFTEDHLRLLEVSLSLSLSLSPMLSLFSLSAKILTDKYFPC